MIAHGHCIPRAAVDDEGFRGQRGVELGLTILVVNWRGPRHPQAGGAEVHLHEICRRLVARGHHVDVLCSGWRGGDRLAVIDGVSYHRTGGDKSFLICHRRAFARLLSASAYDLIIDDISKIPLGLPARCNVPVMAWCHHIHGKTLYQELPAPLAWMIHHRERAIPKLYARCPILAVSQSTRDELVALGVDGSYLGLQPNGIDHQLIRSCPAPKSETPLFVYLGRLERYKNIDCIIRSFARVRDRHPQAKLMILGKGNDQPRLRKLVERLQVGGVVFRGYVTDVQKSELLHRAWLLLASSSKEGWGICVIEANAAGTPVIASDVPGHRDSVLHGETGLLYPFDNSAAMAHAIEQCISEPTLINRLASRARQWANRFTWDSSTDMLLDSIARFHPQLSAKSLRHPANTAQNKVSAAAAAANWHAADIKPKPREVARHVS